MFKNTEIDFHLDGVQGDLRLTYNMLGTPKLYQNGQPVKREGIFKAKYKVQTNDPANPIEELELRRGLTFTYSARFRGVETILEQKLSTLELVIGLVPFILLIFTGGALGALIGIIAVQFIFNFMRNESKMAIKVLVAFLIFMIAYLIYFALAMGVGLFAYLAL